MNAIRIVKGKKDRVLFVFAVLFTYFIFESAVHAENNFATTYHVYVDEKYIGSVSNDEVIHEALEEERKQKEKQFNNLQLKVNEKVTFVPEASFQRAVNNEKVINSLKNHLTYSVVAYKLAIENEAIGYFKDEQSAEEVLSALKQQYVSDEILENLQHEVRKVSLEEKKDALTTDEMITLQKLRTVQDKHPKSTVSEEVLENISDGEVKVVDVQILEDIILEEVYISPDEVTDAASSLETLEQGKVELLTHKVEENEDLQTILEQYNVTEEELKVHNEELVEEDNLKIKDGDTVNIPTTKPYVTIVVTEVEAEEQEVEFETEYVEDDSLYKGEQKVVEEGKPGVKTLYYEITKINGEVDKKYLIKEKITTPPTNKVIAKGTKPIPPKKTTNIPNASNVPASGKLAWPTAGGIITSYMGPRWGSYHNGIDIAGVSNKAIYAADSGVVVFAGFKNNGYGNRVEIRHSNGLVTTYSHLSSIHVSAGQTVQKGQAIGTMGRTGHATGVHLHFETYQNGALVNPLKFY